MVSIIGGFLISSSIDFSGLEMSYMYPDGLTALVGHFQNEKMVKAYSTEVIGMSRACFLSEDGVGDEPQLDGLLPSSTCPCHKLLMIPRFKTVDKKVSQTVHLINNVASDFKKYPKLNYIRLI